ncbi:MAG: transposase [Peptococcaceae bacterium]|nr:transposase [Peptococcaceae bacterium]
MSKAGEIKSKTLEYVLSVIGMLFIAALILLGAGVGYLMKLPYVVTGGIVGVIVAVVMIRYSFSPFRTYTCPNCGTTHKLIDDIGSYECSVCGHRAVIQKYNLEGLYPTYPPTDN